MLGPIKDELRIFSYNESGEIYYLHVIRERWKRINIPEEENGIAFNITIA
jgi:hypothetical protein